MFAHCLCSHTTLLGWLCGQLELDCWLFFPGSPEWGSPEGPLCPLSRTTLVPPLSASPLWDAASANLKHVLPPMQMYLGKKPLAGSLFRCHSPSARPPHNTLLTPGMWLSRIRVPPSHLELDGEIRHVCLVEILFSGVGLLLSLWAFHGGCGPGLYPFPASVFACSVFMAPASRLCLNVSLHASELVPPGARHPPPHSTLLT